MQHELHFRFASFRDYIIRITKLGTYAKNKLNNNT